jgi:dTDP-glucose 4,6-dehydratase
MTEPLWEEMRGGRLFVTGGTGFFGAWLLESFHWANDRLGLRARVTALTRDPDRFQARMPHLFEKTTVRAGDVRDYSWPPGSFSHIVHAAADASTALTQDNTHGMVETIVRGTDRTLRFAEACAARRFLFVSSGAVYSTPSMEAGPVSETCPADPDPTSPKFPYSNAKCIAEDMTTSAASAGIDTSIARCFCFAGPYMPLASHFAFGNFVRDSLAGGPVRVTGDGSAVRSYLYGADLAVWLWTLLFRGSAGEAYNVGSEHAVRIDELARRIAESVGPEIEVHALGKGDPSRGTRQRYVPSTARARHELGLRETYSLEETIRRTVRHYAGFWQADSNPNGELWHKSELETPPLAMASSATSLPK